MSVMQHGHLTPLQLTTVPCSLYRPMIYMAAPVACVELLSTRDTEVGHVCQDCWMSQVCSLTLRSMTRTCMAAVILGRLLWAGAGHPVNWDIGGRFGCHKVPKCGKKKMYSGLWIINAVNWCVRLRIKRILQTF